MSTGEQVEEQFHLRDAPGARPVLSHTSSKQSITAEEEYTAGNSPLLRPQSSGSNEGLLTTENNTNNTNTNNRYSTPPSSPPPTSSPPRQPRLRATRSNGSPSAMAGPVEAPEEEEEQLVAAGTEGNGIRRKPVGNGGSRELERGDSRGSAPTPGVDDTPYIRFALDQLTRDEEVRGSRWYPAGTTDEEINAMEGPVERYTTPIEEPIRPSSAALRDERAFSQSPEVFVPFEHEIAPLRFLPAVLRPIWLLAFVLLCVLMLIALLVSGIWSGTKLGLYRYVSFGGSRYFLFQYLPTLLGMVYLIWIIQIQIAVQRVAPFIAMASYSARSRSEGPFMNFLPTTFLRPLTFYFRAGQPVIGACMIVFWLQIFTIPLFASMYNVQFYGAAPFGHWKWNAVQGVTWTLFTLYLLLIVALLVLGTWIWRQRTGLKWDPRCIADIIALLDRSNITQDYAGAETFRSRKEFEDRLAARTDRLGYWTTSRRPNDVFYGLGEEGGPTRRYSLQGGVVREKPEIRVRASAEALHTHQSNFLDSMQHTYLPWFLRPSLVLLWCVAAIALFLALILASFINNAIVHGFAPLLYVRSNNAGFSSTNFLYSFVPALIAEFLFLAWLNIDYAFRRLQPYAAMSAPHGEGATAPKSLLLDYPARLPFSCTVSAITNGCPRVAWFSFMSVISAVLPVLAGGCFWAQYYQPVDQVRVSAETSGYYALCVLLALYAFSLPLIFIRLRAAALPNHDCASLADIISWLYASGVVGEREWRAPLGSKTEMVTRLVSAATERERADPRRGGAGGEGRFVFGRFVGRDGRVHLGIERLGRFGGHRLSLAEKDWPLHSEPRPVSTDPRMTAVTKIPPTRADAGWTLGTRTFRTAPPAAAGMVAGVGGAAAMTSATPTPSAAPAQPGPRAVTASRSAPAPPAPTATSTRRPASPVATAAAAAAIAAAADRRPSPPPPPVPPKPTAAPAGAARPKRDSWRTTGSGARVADLPPPQPDARGGEQGVTEDAGAAYAMTARDKEIMAERRLLD